MNREDFPILSAHPELVYLDSANTALKPQTVVDAVTRYCESIGANVGRASYTLGEEATREFEAVRGSVAGLIGCSSDEVVFTYSTTYGLNQVARGFMHRLETEDVILLSLHEHNSNLVVWQKVAEETGAKIQFAEEEFELERVKIFSYALVSNVTGQIFDYAELIGELRENGALVCVDAAQAVGRREVSVVDLDCDFLVFSSHKIGGPSGVGVLYCRRDLMDEMVPLVYGSASVESVGRTKSGLRSGASRFEPGTPNIEGAIGLGAAVEYCNVEANTVHDCELVEAWSMVVDKSGLREWVVGESEVGIFALNHPKVHPHDIAMLLDGDGIAVRAGKMCADLLLDNLGIARGVVRASCGSYTTVEDLRKFAEGYARAIERLDG